ncbi:MAG TPA: SsrA-binding protein SmpB [Dehalococcoidia bacterium]|nr:SsrA-binding protein SmpB [Dehalococcoidia bacterium]
MSTSSSSQDKTISVNRKAQNDYDILQTLEAGLSLLGTEIKSIREGRVSIREAYVRPQNGEMWLVGAHIAHYPPAARMNHDPTRNRRLLLHRKQIRELTQALEAGGLTIVPLRLYLRNGRAKLEIGLARGKRRYDKRADIARREAERRIQQALRRRA